jgi:hypothetical protein
MTVDGIKSVDGGDGCGQPSTPGVDGIGHMNDALLGVINSVDVVKTRETN